MPSSEVPGNFPVALDGRPYPLDNAGDPPLHRHASVPLLRSQSDVGENVGEQSINPAGLWRRSIESWHRGAGQEFYDRSDSDPARFLSSKGVNVWTENQLTLLSTVTTVTTFTPSEFEDAQNRPRIHRVSHTSGDFVFTNMYLWDGENVLSENGAWAALAGSPSTEHWCGGIVSDGEYTYVHLGENGLWAIEGDDDSMALCVSASGFAEGFVGFANGRLFVSIGNVLYNVVSIDTGTPPALPSPLLTHPSATWDWRGCASGPTHSYLGGYGGGISRVYKTTIEADGTSLDVPTVAAELPTGEVLTTIFGYLNQFVLIGTAEGVRLATIGADGSLSVGALIELGYVYSFAAYGRFVWVAGQSPDGVDPGLWRLDLMQINDTAPAYAADLYVAAEPNGYCFDVLVVAPETPMFVTSTGVYTISATPLTSGTLDQGWITYKIAEDKIAYSIDVRHEPLASGSTVGVSTAVNGVTSYTSAGTSSTAAAVQATLTPTNVTGSRINLRTTLTTSASATPNLDVVTLSSIPTTDSGYQIIVPLLLAGADPGAELEHIKGLRAARTPVEYQEGTVVYSVIVEDFQWAPTDPIADGSAWTGTCVVTLKVLSSEALSAPVYYGGGYQ